MGNIESAEVCKAQAVRSTQNDQNAKKGLFQDIVEDIAKERTGRRCILNVERSLLWQSALSYLKEKRSEFCPLDVKFLTGSREEEVINLGGPNREFFTLLLEEFRSSKLAIFEGHGGYLIPMNNRTAIDNGLFFCFGKAIVVSLCSGGPGFPYFPPYIISYFRDQMFEHELSTLYVVSTYLKEYIEKINSALTQDDLDTAVGEDTNGFIEHCGWPVSERITLGTKLHYIQTLLKWDLFDKRSAALEQIKKGLNVLHFLERTKTLSDFEFLLLHRSKCETTADFIKSKLKPEVQKLETKDAGEEKAKKFTLECLENLEDEEAGYMFQFLTGLDDVPVHNFPVQVEFNRTRKDLKLPEAITCVQLLRIPLGNKSKMEFYASFQKALTLGRLGFSERTLR